VTGTGSTARLGWLVLLLLVGTGCAAGPAVSGNPSAADVRPAKPVQVSTEPQPPAECTLRADYRRAEPATAPASDVPVVPVAIFLMRNDACGDFCRLTLRCATNSPDCWWTPDKVHELFSRGQGVDGILQPAVRLAVDRVFECQYRPADFLQGRHDVFMPKPNRADPTWERRYRKINEHFGLDKRVNLVVWLQIGLPNELGVDYYGTSPLRAPDAGSRRLGVVWADRVCLERTFGAGLCARKLAHEIGHALGLVHVPPDEPPRSDRAELAVCGRDQEHDPDRTNLMARDGTAGQKVLTPTQICKMRLVAERHYR
jgi:hypothetical protein